MVSDSEIAYELGWTILIFITISMYISMRQDFLPQMAAHGILRGYISARERYKKFFIRGCSASPVELLKIAGVNLETPKPIQALDVFGEVLPGSALVFPG